MKRIALALATALGVSLILVTAAFAWQDRINGYPQSFEAGGTAGVYFWHGNDGLHLRTTDPENAEHWYYGVISTDGQFNNLKLVKAEQDDHAEIVGPGDNELDFRFHTFSGIDGMDFRIDGGTYQTLTLYRDGAPLPIDSTFLGMFSVHPDSEPFPVCRDGSTCYETPQPQTAAPTLPTAAPAP
ncbi:MAG TPA: hypothetical protein VND24_07260 [Steroidobacteraceae bacterium]|nr:hypothetical protein [Steroidobacteraceae bacterium]